MKPILYVTFAAFLLVASSSGRCSAQAQLVQGDLNLDGVVDFTDFLLFAKNYGKEGGAYTSSFFVGYTWCLSERNGRSNLTDSECWTLNENGTFVKRTEVSWRTPDPILSRGNFSITAIGDGSAGTIIFNFDDGQVESLDFRLATFVGKWGEEEIGMVIIKPNGDRLVFL